MSNTNNTGTGFLLKGIITAILILAMLIPAAYVQSLVEERKQRQTEVTIEVSSKWAGSQVVAGPFLVIPYSYQQLVNEKQTETIYKQFIVLPETLNVKGTVTPQVKKRSIYKVALYQSSLQLSGQFNLANVQAETGEEVHWKDARLCMGITDTRGILTQVQGSWQKGTFAFDAGLPENPIAGNGMSVPVDLSAPLQTGIIDFSIPVQLKGSEALQLLPLGKTTTFSVQSPWHSPSFIGKFLPQYTPGEKGFSANWQVLHFNRDFPQVWKNQRFKAADYAFGVSLLQPADNYAKTMRSVKYAILFIGLTFGFFFLLEIMLGYKVHPVQYVLVGIALMVFYTLLLSIGEMLTFNAAYLIAMLSTASLITLYSRHLFATWKNGLMIGSFISGLYVFIYVLIQLEDTALLAGSIGLFFLVALAMYFSRKISWYGPSKELSSASSA